MQYYSPRYTPAIPDQSAKRRLSRPALFLLSAGVAFTVLALGALGMFLYFGGQYGQAETLLKAKDFKGAQECLMRVPAFYKDAPKLIVYAQGSEALEAGKFYEAAEYFGKIGGFEDAAQLLDYAQAGEALDAGKFDEARDLYNSLDGFRDSKTMLQEVSYRQASQLYTDGDLKSALAAFQGIASYKDSSDMAVKIAGEVFTAATNLYIKADYAQAKEKFSWIQDTNHDAAGYLTLIEAHGKTFADSARDYTGMKALFGKLTALGSLGDAKALRAVDAFIFFRLEGNWKTTASSQILDFHFESQESAWYMHQGKIDGVTAKLENGCIYGWYNGSWIKAAEFVFTADDALMIKWSIDGREMDVYYTRE